MMFIATKAKVKNRGRPPDGFLEELVRWASKAPEDIFETNAEPGDVYGSIKYVLGPWNGADGTPQRSVHRRAAMAEILRVLAGFESTWNWKEGRDTTNSTSNRPETEEAGAWQVSENSEFFGRDLRNLVSQRVRDMDGDNDVDADDFRAAMKLDHPLAFEYVARLLRHTCAHNGPVKRHEIDPWLSRESVEEFEGMISSGLEGLGVTPRDAPTIPPSEINNPPSFRFS